MTKTDGKSKNISPKMPPPKNPSPTTSPLPNEGPNITLGLTISKEHIYQRAKTVNNKYVSLTGLLDNSHSPMFRLSPACPASEILVQLKQQWGLPQEMCFLSKITGLYYVMYPIDGTGTIDPLPLNKIPREKLGPFKQLIQRLFLYRYLSGLSMNMSDLYCTFSTDNEINCIYSYRESKPYGLTPKSDGLIPKPAPNCKSVLPENVLKLFFDQESPYEVLAKWWGLTLDNKERKAQELYSWLRVLVEGRTCYSAMPELMFLRLIDLIM